MSDWRQLAVIAARCGEHCFRAEQPDEPGYDLCIYCRANIVDARGSRCVGQRRRWIGHRWIYGDQVKSLERAEAMGVHARCWSLMTFGADHA